MQTHWPTEEKDLEVAKNIIEEYSRSHDNPTLGIFEVVVSEDKEAPDVHLSEWVVTLTDYFEEKYGAELGDAVTKKVISRCMTLGKSVH
jgi:ABC-type proline/glycine betaine transport system substrate-binding protein